jgi:hypothetical protein
MFYMARPEARDIQLDLVLSYRTNVALYARFQRYFGEHQPPLLAVWGKNDPFFIPPVRKPTSAIFLTPRSISPTRDISRLRRIAMRSPRACGTFWPGT